MSQKEAVKIQNPIRKLFEAEGFYTKKIAGSIASPGMPDTLLVAPSGIMAFIEFKYTERREMSLGQLCALLEGPQRLTFYNLGEKQAPAFIVAGNAKVAFYCTAREYYSNHRNAEIVSGTRVLAYPHTELLYVLARDLKDWF